MSPNESPHRSSSARPGTMKAARVHQWGSPEVITVESVDLPEPADEELLVRVHAAGGFGRGREGRREDNRFCCRRRGIRRH